jgi:hypothetical protein
MFALAVAKFNHGALHKPYHFLSLSLFHRTCLTVSIDGHVTSVLSPRITSFTKPSLRQAASIFALTLRGRQKQTLVYNLLRLISLLHPGPISRGSKARWTPPPENVAFPAQESSPSCALVFWLLGRAQLLDAVA